MASASRFSIFPLSFVHTGGTLNLLQLSDFNISTNVRDSEIIPGGAVDRARIGVVSADPTMTFSTMDLTTFFGTVSPTVGLLATGAVTFRLQERTDGGTFQTGATHETFAAGAGSFLRPVSLSAGQDDDGAVLQAEVTPISASDGIVAPIAHATGVDFDGLTAPAFASRFYLGPVYHNSVLLPGVLNTSIDFGINYEAKRFDGKPYAQAGAIITRTPRFTFTTAKADVVSALDMFGRAVTNSVVFYYWADVANSTRVALGTTGHLEIACTAGKWCHENVQVSGNDDGTVSVTIIPTGVIAVNTLEIIDGNPVAVVNP